MKKQTILISLAVLVIVILLGHFIPISRAQGTVSGCGEANSNVVAKSYRWLFGGREDYTQLQNSIGKPLMASCVFGSVEMSYSINIKLYLW